MAGVVQDYVTGLREVSQTYQEHGDGHSVDPQETLQANLRYFREYHPELSPSERMREAVEESKAEIVHTSEQWEAIPDSLKAVEASHNQQIQQKPGTTAIETLDDYKKEDAAEVLHARFEELKSELRTAATPEQRDEIMDRMRGVVQQEKQVGGREASYDESRVADRSEGYGY